MAGIFQWRESYPRFACVDEALKSKRLKFETRTTAEYDPDIDSFAQLEYTGGMILATTTGRVIDRNGGAVVWQRVEAWAWRQHFCLTASA